MERLLLDGRDGAEELYESATGEQQYRDDRGTVEQPGRLGGADTGLAGCCQERDDVAVVTEEQGSAVTTTAPATLPVSDPRPPMMIIARKSMERTNPKLSGTIRPNTNASSTPARPA
jgi:hypothetical protein